MRRSRFAVERVVAVLKWAELGWVMEHIRKVGKSASNTGYICGYFLGWQAVEMALLLAIRKEFDSSPGIGCADEGCPEGKANGHGEQLIRQGRRLLEAAAGLAGS